MNVITQYRNRGREWLEHSAGPKASIADLDDLERGILAEEAQFRENGTPEGLIAAWKRGCSLGLAQLKPLNRRDRMVRKANMVKFRAKARLAVPSPFIATVDSCSALGKLHGSVLGAARIVFVLSGTALPDDWADIITDPIMDRLAGLAASEEAVIAYDEAVVKEVVAQFDAATGRL